MGIEEIRQVGMWKFVSC